MKKKVSGSGLKRQRSISSLELTTAKISGEKNLNNRMIRQDIIKNPDTDRLSVTYILNPGSGSRKSDISRG